MQLTEPGLVPHTSLAGLTVPAANPATAFVAPTPDQPNYPARLQVLVHTAVTDPFLAAVNASGGTAVWQLQTSAPTADLASEAARSPLLGQYAATLSNGLAREGC